MEAAGVLERGCLMQVADGPDAVVGWPTGPRSRISPSRAGGEVEAGWHTKEVPGPTHALFLTKQPIAPPEMRYETGISVNRISETQRRTGKTPGQFALEFAARVVSGEGATVTQIDEDGRRLYVLRDAVQRDPGLPDLRKQYVIVADDTRDLVYLIFFETPAASWEANWAIAAPVLDLSHLGVEGRPAGDRPNPP